MKILSSLLAIVLWTVTTHAQPSFVPHSLSEVSGSNAGEFFGFSLACVDSGNLLGVITGIPFRTVGGQVAAGAVGIIDPRDFTNNTFISTPHPATSGRFGYSVINFDDLTSDGTDEFLVGAPGEDRGGNPGIGTVYALQTNFSEVRRIGPPTGASTGEAVEWGYVVAEYADVSGGAGSPSQTPDGTDEVLIAAPNFSGGGGIVDMIDLGNTAMTSAEGNSVLRFSGASGDRLGEAIAVLANVEMTDTLPEVVITSADAASGAGIVNVFLSSGFSSLIDTGANLSSPTISIMNPSTGLNFGRSLADAGDVNGDGLPDLLIGATDKTAPPANAGRVLLISGADIAAGASVPTPLCNLTSPSTGIPVPRFFGQAVLGLGDLTGDGHTEFAVTQRRNDSTANAGTIFIYTYDTTTSTCNLRESFTAAGVTTNQAFGNALALANCNFNADAIKDLAIGTRKSLGGGMLDGGSVSLYIGQGYCGDGVVIGNEQCDDGNNTSNDGCSSTCTSEGSATPTPTPGPSASPSPSPTPIAAPSSVELNYRISRTGRITATASFDAAPTQPCDFEVFGRATVGRRKVGPVHRLDTGQVHSQFMRFEDTGLPLVAKVDGRKPAMHILMRVTCGQRVFDSNVAARFLNCGEGETGVSIKTWVDTVRRKFARSEHEEGSSLQALRDKKKRRRRKRNKKRSRP